MNFSLKSFAFELRCALGLIAVVALLDFFTGTFVEDDVNVLHDSIENLLLEGLDSTRESLKHDTVTFNTKFLALQLNETNTTTPATCTDETQNGDEKGVDCGGSCGKCGEARVNETTVADAAALAAAIKQTFGVEVGAGSLTDNQRKTIVAALKETVAIKSDKKVYAVVKVNATASVPLSTPGSNATAVLLSDMGNVSAAVVQVVSPADAATQLGLNLTEGKEWLTSVISIERMDANGSEISNMGITFTLYAMNESVTVMAVMVYDKNGVGADISAHGGKVTALGGGAFEVIMTHTSTFAGYDPTCTDETQNGDETGVDCGGSCGACAVSPVPSSPVASPPAPSPASSPEEKDIVQSPQDLTSTSASPAAPSSSVVLLLCLLTAWYLQ